MPNYYPPTNLSIKNILGDTAIITWDVHNAIEFKAGTKYNIYVSGDDSVYTLLSTVNRIEAAVPLKDSNRFVKVTSVTPMLGESDKSSALQIKSPVTLAEYKEATPVGVDILGKSRYLSVDEQGRLKVSDTGISNALIGVSTEAKQDVNIALLSEIRDYFSPGLAKENKQDIAIMRLVEMRDIIAQINTNTQVGNLKISETLLTSVTPIGKKITLPFWSRAKLEQVTCLHEGGAATKFVMRVWRRKTSTSQREILAEFESYNNPRLDVIRSIPYINLDGTDEITIEVLPDNGTSNDFYVRIAGSLAF